MAQRRDLIYPHFALIYIDRDGNLRQESSQSLANSRDSILSPRVTDMFLRAVAMSGETESPHTQWSGLPSLLPQRLSNEAPLPARMGHELHGINTQGTEDNERTISFPQGSLEPATWLTPRESWPQTSPKAKEPLKEEQKVLISTRDKDILRQYYEKAFKNLQQTNCRVLAKAYIKLVEPRKQVNYPYNGRKIVAGTTCQLEPDDTKPPWWPSGVSHREPDHLPRAERIRLLVHLLCEMHNSHGITVQKLKEAYQPIRRQISPAERQKIMDEVYEVREEEEKYLEGLVDGRTHVLISRTNLPNSIEDHNSHPESSRKSKTAKVEKDAEKKLSIRTASARVGNTSFINPGNPPTNPHAIPRTTHVKQDPVILEPHEQASILGQDQSRKRQCVETELFPTASPPSTEFYPVFVGSQSFVTDSLHCFQDTQKHEMSNIQTSTASCGNAGDSSLFPHHFGV
ncbi:hypothetical protein N7495_009192 [Penicillium taxi]|uniref:uncharacterized protein n=1 Tax=Penicillium taxi TaxID=168475 RepID=UPI0025452FD6|nr:uncharacterized protein N7495_009192 [Penicillium taxi]KAJ5884682.1 hypothetical protein N7495_009192 [Penicillium taxi]